MDQDVVYPRCVVVCRNKSGRPELHTCAPEVTPTELTEGLHYRLAMEIAQAHALEPVIAFDATDPAAREMGDASLWLHACPPCGAQSEPHGEAGLRGAMP